MHGGMTREQAPAYSTGLSFRTDFRVYPQQEVEDTRPDPPTAYRSGRLPGTHQRPTNSMILAVYIMGVATVLLSVWAACAFARQRGALPRALSAQLLGEAVIGVGTLAFAWGAHSGSLTHWSPEFQSALRVTMFAATSLTTAHLVFTIRNL